MIRFISDKDAKALESKLNELGPAYEVLTVYAVNQCHCAWVREIERKGEKKGNRQ